MAWPLITGPSCVAAGVAGRGGGGVPLEVTGEVRLVVEADGGGDLGWRCAPEHEAAGGVDAAADHVGVRAQAELAGEAPDQVGDAALERGGRPGQADLAGDVIIEELPQLPGDARLRPGHRAGYPGQMAGDPLSDPREPRLCVQGFWSGRQAVMQLR
jgi:hypothetical protein